MRKAIILQLSSFGENSEEIKNLVHKKLIEKGEELDNISINIICYNNDFISIYKLGFSFATIRFLETLKIKSLNQLAKGFKSKKIEPKKKRIILEIQQALTERGLL